MNWVNADVRQKLKMNQILLPGGLCMCMCAVPWETFLATIGETLSKNDMRFFVVVME